MPTVTFQIHGRDCVRVGRRYVAIPKPQKLKDATNWLASRVVIARAPWDHVEQSHGTGVRAHVFRNAR